MTDDSLDFIQEVGQGPERVCEQCGARAQRRIGKFYVCRPHYTELKEWMREQGIETDDLDDYPGLFAPLD